uniref:RecA family profile 1 domain-containing protein n=1 Tax=Pseudictyota dubia TaxID=2749911 RepID=A0A7R9VCI5_9STRA
MICESGGTAAAGGVTQVRECVGLFLRLAKMTGTPVVLVGHVTKSGGVAGPRTVEHMVDCVLYLEGDRGGLNNLRMLRAAKNRFGSSEEVGVYEMDQTGGKLVPVSDPSSLFLSNRFDTFDSDGCAITVMLEGLRPMTVEVQALVTASSTGGKSFAGRRCVDGISTARLLLILAVLQKRCGISFSRYDVYVNVVGGIRLSSNARQGSESDLATAVALVSSLTGIAVRADTAFVGEVGLLGELRQVISLEKRVNEARRMGFSRIITPDGGRRRKGSLIKKESRRRHNNANGIEWIKCEGLLDAISAGLVSRLPLTKGNRLKMPKSEIGSGDVGTLIIDDDDYDDERD